MSEGIAQLIFTNQDKKTVTKQVFVSDDILTDFVNLIDIHKDDTIVQCLEKLLSKMDLPQEATKLDKLAGVYSQRLFKINKHNCRNQVGLFIFLYSLFMLHEDLINSSSVKMSVKDFIRSSQTIDDNEEFSKEYLTKVYEDMVNLYSKPQDAIFETFVEFEQVQRCVIC